MTRLFKIWVAVLTVFLLAACATTQKTEEDPFLDKWLERAEQSRGHSPPPREPSVKEASVFRTIEDVREPEEPRPLPQETISDMKFRDDDLRVILRTLAMAAGKNMVMSSSVEGQMSLDLKEIPWDQAFLSILRTNGLSYSWEGDIIRVKSIEDKERDISLRRVKRDSEPLVTTVLDVEYAHIVDRGVDNGDYNLDQLKETLQDLLDNMGYSDEAREGRVFVDRENNALIVQATEEDTERILHVFKNLERPRKQIHIEASIVEATRRTARELGMRWSGRYITPLDFFRDRDDAFEFGWDSVGTPLPDEAGYAGDMDLSLISARLPGSVLYAHLQALEREGEINILSTPSLTTMDNQMAFTEHGERVPFETIDEDGDRVVRFEDVALRLEVVPRVINGDEMAMRILVTKDEVDFTREVRGNPLIRTKQTETNLVVRSGETIVISGLTKQTEDTMDRGVPGLKDLPGLGWLFKSQEKTQAMEEFMVFITPSILQEAMRVQ